MTRSRLLGSAAILVIVVLSAGCAGALSSPSAQATPSAGASVSPSVAASSAPAATATPPASSAVPIDNYLAGLRYTCGGADFPIEMFDTPEKAEESTDPPAAVLRGDLMLFATITWWLVDRTPSTAQYVGMSQGGEYWDLFAERKDGTWRATGYGNCLIRAVVPDATVVTWWIRKDSWPSPADRTLHLAVRDECPKTVADRVLEPVVRMNDSSIVLVLPTRPIPPPHPHCGFPEGNEQVASVTVTLDEPVGDRSIFDGETLPLRDAHTPSDQIAWCCG